MTASQFLFRYASTANSYGKAYNIPALALLTVGAWLYKWGYYTVDFKYVIKKIQQAGTYNIAKNFITNGEKYCNLLFGSNDKNSYTLKSYVKMFKIVLGYDVNLVYSDYVVQNQSEFLRGVISVSRQLNISPDWLMIVIYNESKFNHTKPNPYTGAVGLIQFMPGTARALGTSIEALSRMSNIEQLQYVYKYFKVKAGKLYSLYDLYKYTFFPVSLGKSPDWVFKSSDLSASTIARQNKIFDINRDGMITVDEFEQYLYNTYISNLI